MEIPVEFEVETHRLCRICFFLSLPGIILPVIFAQDLPWVAIHVGGLIGLSGNFITDTVYSVIVALIIWSLARCNPTSDWVGSATIRPVKYAFTYLASISFSIYLFHRPLIVLTGAMFEVMKDIPQQLIAIFCILCVIAILTRCPGGSLAVLNGGLTCAESI